MKKSLPFTIGIVFLFAFCIIYPQQNTLSTGKAPFNKAHSHINYGTSPLAFLAYANDLTTNKNISMPIPDGTPFTILGTFGETATSMCKGGDGKYYLIGASLLYQFHPESGNCSNIGYITGMDFDSPNGISYNPSNDTYYLVGLFGFYSLDINTHAATLIGNFSGLTGYLIDLCFDEYGVCYAYEINTTPGAANAYIIDISDASLTPLGYVGFTPNYAQGMSYDFESGIIYLAAFNYDTNSGQLRTMDKTTGMTTLVYDWGDEIAPFALNTQYGPPCSIQSPGNPNPPTGTIDVSVFGTTLTWDNGAGATNVEVWFGTPGNVTQVYNGTPITSWSTGSLIYNTEYTWGIVDGNDTCSTSSPNWTFTTEQSPGLIVEDFYPMNTQYWTGSTDGYTKTDGEINTVYPNVGWAVYDISGIPQFAPIQNVMFYGYVNATNFPFWSATPMGDVNPVIDDAATINDQILSSYDDSIAYIYSNESSLFTTGWHNYTMGNTAFTDIQDAVNAEQGWFAMGFVDRDFSATYFINLDGWSQPNPPYLEITYVPTPVELTSFHADVNGGNVVLNWQTATETNNKGFEVERSQTSDIRDQTGWEKIGFVDGNGTSTEMHTYSYTDKDIIPGKYNYRLKQIDFDGTSEYSKEVEVNVNLPKVYSLSQNFPNPFNPTTQINFTLAADSKVALKIFDIVGQEILTLLNGNMTAGIHNITFDASKLASGIYLYRIEANGVDGSRFSSIKKMMLMK